MTKKELLKLIRFISRSSVVKIHINNLVANLDEISFTINETGETTIHMRGEVDGDKSN